jgi:ribosomal protein S18 acetylase RimI-like enzyme
VLSFRTADQSSLESFLSVSAASRYQPELEEYCATLLRQRSTKPSWCIIAFESGRPVARAALWSMPDQAIPSDLVLIHADWDDRALANGRALLAHLHERAAGLGAEALQHHVDNPPGPPQYQEDESARVRLLTESGYDLLRDGLRWLYTTSAADHQAQPEATLAFRGLPDVGEDAFVDAIAATYEGTRDTWLTRTIEERGLLGAARSDFLDYRQMDHRPDWWELAYTPEGALAGVIMAARNPGSAVIAYVGVAPEQRGRGFAPQLVRRGTQHLVAAGDPEIRGDCDRDNVAMVKAFQRAGYEEIARRRSYVRTLAG